MNRVVISFFLLFSVINFAQTTPGEYTIKILKNNSKHSDFGPAFNTSEKIIFSSGRGNALNKNGTSEILDLFEGTISSDGEINDIKKLPIKINSKGHKSNVSFNPDNTVVYFTLSNTQSQDVKSVVTIENASKRPSRGRKPKDKVVTKKVKYTTVSIRKSDVSYDGTWSKNIVSLPFNNKNYMVGHPAVNKDGTKLYFASNIPGTLGESDIFVVDIHKDGTYSEPRNLGSQINTSGNEIFPFIDKKDILYFASNGRNDGFGGLDIYAVKIYGDNDYSEILHLGAPVNTENDDFALIINNETNQGYFSSNRKGLGSDDLYHFVANPPLQIGCFQTISGIVKDDKHKTIENTVVRALDVNGKEYTKTKTDHQGKYKLNLPCDTKVKLAVSKIGYKDLEKEVMTTKAPIGKNADLSIEKIKVCKQLVSLQVKNMRTSRPVPYAMITVYDKNGTELFNKKASGKGRLVLELLCNQEFKVKGSLKKYDDNEMLLAANDGNKPQEAVLELKLTPNLEEVTIKKNKVIVNVNAIYFPINSSAITPTAMAELTKVVDLMLKYPKLKIEGGSHTDSRGRADLNLKLSYERANATVNYIINQGISPNRITARGYGETQPVNKCVDGVKCTNAQYQLNRRTEFVILNPEVLEYY